MLAIAGYKINEKLYSSEKVTIYRAIRLSDNLPVVIKLLAKEFPNEEEIARLKHEFEIIKKTRFALCFKNI